jgi:hypothetical protein
VRSSKKNAVKNDEEETERKTVVECRRQPGKVATSNRSLTSRQAQKRGTRYFDNCMEAQERTAYCCKRAAPPAPTVLAVLGSRSVFHHFGKQPLSIASILTTRLLYNTCMS